MMTALLMAAAMQSAAINSQRDKYLSCLDAAFESAKSQKLPAEGLDAHLRQACAAVESSFEAALIGFDVKNKVPRKQAASDAQIQVDDFVTNLVERYRMLAARQ
jgi:hypothetical protein